MKKKLYILFFVGDTNKIINSASKLDWDIKDFPMYNTLDDIECVKKACSLASDKSVSAIMKGYINTDVLLAGLIDKKMSLLKDRYLSHIFYMTIEGSDKALMITDGVLNVAPNEKIKKRYFKKCYILC